MAHDLLNREKIEYSANQSEIEHVLKQIEQEKQNLGKDRFGVVQNGIVLWLNLKPSKRPGTTQREIT